MNINPRLLNFAKRSSGLFTLTIIFGFIGGILIILQADLISKVINRVFLDHQTVQDVLRLMILLALVIVGRGVFIWGSEVSAKKLAVRIKEKLRIQVLEHITELGPEYIHEERTGELINSLVTGIESLDAYFSQYLPQLVLVVLIPISILIVVFPIDTLTGFVFLVTAPVIPIFMVLIGSIAESITKKQWASLNRMSVFFLDALQGLTTLKILGQSSKHTKTIENISSLFRNRTMSVLRVTFLSALVLELAATLSTAVVAVEIGLRLMYGWLEFEQTLFVLLLAPEFYMPLRTLGARFHAGMTGITAFNQIEAILEKKVDPEDWQTSKRVEEFKLTGNLCFTNVSVRFDDARNALSDINLEIPSGKKTALVGRTGAGKSTLVNTLMKFLEPSDGTILIGNIPLREIPGETWWKSISWVPQKPYLFNQSILENIRLGKKDASLEEVRDAARKAHIDGFIEALPEGYHTVIGEQGAKLSGGQAQRIAIARAFIKDAPIVILDEPSSNLDPMLEAMINQSIDELSREKTTIVIAHRLMSVVNAHQIIVMEQGQVIQQGKHKDLLDADGLYRELMQSLIDPEQGDFEEMVTHKVISFETEKQIDEPVTMLERLSYGEPEPSKHLNVLKDLFQFVKPFKNRVGLSVLLGFATVGSSIGLMGTSAYIISLAALHPSIAELQVAIVGVRLFGILKGVFRYLERYVSHDVTFRVLAKLRVWFYGKLEPLAPARLLEFRSGDLLNRMISDIESLENFYVRVIAPPVSALLVILVSGLLLLNYGLELSIVLVITLLLTGLGVPWVIHRANKKNGETYTKIHSDLTGKTIDYIHGLPDLMISGQIREYQRSVFAVNSEISSIQVKMGWITGAQKGLFSVLSNIGMWLILILSAQLVSAGTLDGIYLAVITLIALASFEAIQPLPQAAEFLGQNISSANRLFDLVGVQPAVKDTDVLVSMPGDISIRVEDMEFQYLPDVPTLSDISFSLESGRKMAVVGPSGAGKSSLIHLLMRFWEFDQGDIKIDNNDIRSFTQQDVRNLFSVVSQNTYLFNESIMDNIRRGKPDASMDEVIDAANRAKIHRFINGLPDGYDTWVGERGLKLSGGERQRIVIARAILQNHQVLILDEATANLDSITERQLLLDLFDEMEGKSLLNISHRLVGMEKMDEILVLDRGSIKERGTHQDLLAKRGMYYDMWMLQNLIYLPVN